MREGPTYDDDDAMIGPDNIWDRFGGHKMAIAFAVVAVLVVVIDGLLLPPIVGSLDPAREFLSNCDGSTLATAGGFALGLAVATVLLVVGLSLSSPRGLRNGALVFIMVLTAQWYVGYNFGMTPTLLSWPFNLAYSGDFFCASVSDILHQRYNATPPGDLPYQFTDMMFFNLALLVLFAAILVVIGLLRVVFSKLFGSGEPPASAPEPIAFFRGPERIVLVQSVLGITVLLMMAPMLLMTAEDPSNWSRSVWDFLWVGPFVLLVDLARLMLVPAIAEQTDVTEEIDPAATAEPELFLPAVATRLKAVYDTRPDNLDFVIPKIKVQASPTTEDTTKIPEAGTVRHLKGTLKADNYGYVLSYLNQAVLDAGRSALVICPNESLDVIADNILDRLNHSSSSLVSRTWRANAPLQNDSAANVGAVEVIFASPETLGELVTHIRALRGELATLGGVFIFGLHRMDIGLLNLGLRRLKPFVDHPNRMIGVVQSEERGALFTVVRHLPLLNELSNPVDIPLVNLDRNSPAHTLVVRPSQEADFTRRENWPLWAQMLISARKDEPRADAFVFDTDARFPAGAWREEVVQQLDGNEDNELVSWARQLAMPVLSPIDAGHPVGLLQDQGNLADALRIGIADSETVETFRLILTSDYPGASFLRQRLKYELDRADRSADALRQSVQNFSDSFGSVLPTPRGGPVEMALMVQQEYYSAIRGRADRSHERQVLRQDHLDRLWAQREGPLEKLGITNTRVGLERLFRQTYEVSSSSDFVTRTESEDRRWMYRLADQSLAHPDMLANMRVELGQGAVLLGSEQPGGFSVPLADHGLSYDDEVRLLIGGNVYEVSNVDPNDRIVTVEPRDKPVRPYAFVRDYAFRLEPKNDIPNFATDARLPVQDTEQPFEIATAYAHVCRHTTAHLEHGSSMNAFGTDNRMPKRKETDVRFDFRIRSVGLLRVYGAGGESGGTPVVGLRRSARRRGGPQAAQNRIDGKIAFTLATTLQDVLALTFHPLAHRIAVVSPEAHLLSPKGRLEWDTTSNYCLQRQPALMRGDPHMPFMDTDRSVTSRHQISEATQSAYGEFFSEIITEARARNNVRPETRKPYLTLAVIEDSDHDLGAVRHLRDSADEVLGLWSDYLNHYENEPARATDFDYAFGAERTADCYDFAGAAEVLRKMRSKKQ